MKKIGIINSELSRVISELGHTDAIVIADCGLPIPPGVRRIDLALKRGVPGYVETLETILEEMQVERYTVAAEMKEASPELYEKTALLLDGAAEGNVTHERFKQLTREAKAVVRTGECTPYANVILHAGVIF
ncbi:D-ribose pyranase [Paenibacillus sp. oral taxon 786 str. D14]|uniref:D-ribose pyranase n=1 Tax=Paenibacillus sp. oral taxon 786 TaxID=652715 RepID=UPI0001AFD3F4|nr:D-ribose pyranase [Paenibacillus sp. oral taxon 786]EES74459.1 D-ribose pyranase [Paenibacillus sp. oral taxon 786 str. D14]